MSVRAPNLPRSVSPTYSQNPPGKSSHSICLVETSGFSRCQRSVASAQSLRGLAFEIDRVVFEAAPADSTERLRAFCVLGATGRSREVQLQEILLGHFYAGRAAAA